MHFTKKKEERKIKADKISYKNYSTTFLPKCASVAANRAQK
jgi:hypothetical protein